MGVDFRCERCGGLVRSGAEASGRVRCPHCRARIRIPAALASLPQPKLAAAAEAPGPATERDEAALGAVARMMPWIISGFFHLSILVILAFVTIVILAPETPAEPTDFDANATVQPPRARRIQPGDGPSKEKMSGLEKLKYAHRAKIDSPINTDDLGLGKTERRVRVLDGLGLARGEPDGRGLGLTPGRPGGDPQIEIGTIIIRRARHVVYMVDRSGSMIGTLDAVKDELTRSIGRLGPEQTFHVLFFSEGEPSENPPRRMVPATKHYRLEALEFLRTIRARSFSGHTDPIPALRRAFGALARLGSDEGKVIYLLTDGEFFDNEKVFQAVRKLNAAGDVRMYTVLIHHRAPAAVKILRRIADETKGEFKFVESD